MSRSVSTASDNESIYVLIDEQDDIARFGGPKEISAERLGEQLKRFSEAISKALDKCKSIGGEFDLREISLEAKLSAEFGFMLVSKAGVEGTVTLKFARP